MLQRWTLLLAATALVALEGRSCIAFVAHAPGAGLRGREDSGPLAVRPHRDQPLHQFSWTTAGGSTPLGTVLNLRRADRGPRSDDGDSEGGGKPAQASPDVGDWKISKKRAPGIVDAASDIKDWMLRAVIERNENDEEMLAIANELRFDDSEKDLNEVFGVKGGAAGLTQEGEASTWFRQPKITDKDPSGVVGKAEIMIEKAEELGMSIPDYIDMYGEKDQTESAIVVSPNNRRLDDGVFQFVTTQHAYPVDTLAPRVPFSTCWYGAYVELEAKDKDVEITSLYSQTGIYWREVRDLLNVTVYVCEGSPRGKELSKDEWRQVGSVDDVRMVKVNFTLNSNPTYSKLPLEESITVKAGTVRGILVHTSDARGLAIRGKDKGTWEAGDVTDMDDNIIMRAGLLAVGEDDLHDKVFKSVFHHVDAAAFVGVLDYRILE